MTTEGETKAVEATTAADAATTTTTTTTEAKTEEITFNPEWLRRKEGYVEWETPYEKEWKRYADWPAVATVPEAFFVNGERQPDKPALGEREQIPVAPERPDDPPVPPRLGDYKWLTWAEACETARWIGAGLRALDEERGLGLVPHAGNVGIFSANNPDWVLCEYGAFSQALCVVPVYPTCGAGTISYIVQHADIALVFTNHKVVNALLEDLNLPYERAAPGETVPPTRLRVVVTIGDASRTRPLAEYPLPPLSEKARGVRERFGIEVLSLCELLAKACARYGGVLPPMEPARPDDRYTICYTSGSEGTPKGVEHTHRGALAMTDLVAQCPTWGADVGTWTYYSYLPLAHVFERQATAIFVRTGGTIGYSSGLANLIDDLGLLRPHLLLGVPRVWKRIYDKVQATVEREPFYKRWIFNLAVSRKTAALVGGFQPWVDWDALVLRSISAKLGGRLVAIISGGAAADPALAQWVETVFGTRFCQGYGLTETFAAVAVQHPGCCADKAAIGPPVKGVTMRLTDVPDMGYTTACDRPRGEIWVRGPMIMSQYHGNPAKTREALVDGFFLTGDIAELQPDGALRVIDRKKNLFKLAQGEYIAIEYLETVYSAVPEIEQIWVWGDPLSSFLVAVVVPRVTVLAAALAAEDPAAHYDTLAPADLCARPQAVAHVLRAMDKAAAAAHLLGYQKVKTILLEPHPWTIEAGLLTPTFKLRRGNIKAKYLQQVQELVHNYQPPVAH